MSSLFSSSWPVKTRSCSSTERADSSRPSSARLSSWVMVLSWATPPPLSSRLSAPSTSSTSGLRPARSIGMVAPSFSCVAMAPSSGALELDELLAEQAGLAQLGDRVAGQLDVVADLEGDEGLVALEVDRGHLADADVVDLDRRLRHEVEDVGELDLDRHRVVADVGTAGQRQGVDAGVAGRQGQCRGPGHRECLQALHRATSRRATRPPRVGSKTSRAGSTSGFPSAPGRFRRAPA